MNDELVLLMRATGLDEAMAQFALDLEAGRRPMGPQTEEDTKGGPGSGNFGHAGRPGRVGGSASGEGVDPTATAKIAPTSAKKPAKSAKKPAKSSQVGPSPAKSSQHKPLIGKFASTGCPVDAGVTPAAAAKFIEAFEGLPEYARRNVGTLVLHDHKGAQFTVGGQVFTEGGNWEADQDTINVFGEQAQGVTTSDDPAFYIYHEAGHGIMHAWQKKAAIERSDIRRTHRDYLSKNSYAGFDAAQLEAHRAELEQTHPYAVLAHDWDTAWKAGEDGITPYSTDWAKQGNDSETFAEIAKFALGYASYNQAHAVAFTATVARNNGAPTLLRVFVDLAHQMQADLDATPHTPHTVRSNRA